MFGESESESPRVPSPWDSLIGTPVSSSPASKPQKFSSSPLANPATAIVPKLVPENDDGNVEYKLQLLSPSPARFARLVTQLKWRLLEGGGQAYYELGVADSGALVGLLRPQLEESLETLEMMAGEIGASVIVVKEIEVPAAMAGLAIKEEDHRRVKKVDEYLSPDEETTTETEASSTTDDDDDIFSMDPESEGASPPPQFTIEVEISAVFKPRPVRTKESNKHLTSPEHHRNKNRKYNKYNKLARKNKQTTLKPSAPAIIESASATDSLISGLEKLHVSLDEPQAVTVGDNTLAADDAIPAMSLTAEPESIEGEDDVFVFGAGSTGVVATEDLVVVGPLDEDEKRLIVEALVVRKMSIEEAFLDFEGFGFG